MAGSHPATRRAAAVHKVQVKYAKAHAAWGGPDCLKVVRSLLVALGHKPPRLRRYRSAQGARRALTEQGFDSVEALMDSLLPRIAPAAMNVADIAAMPGDCGFQALVICAGRKVIGFHQDAPGLVNIEPLTFDAAWSVL